MPVSAKRDSRGALESAPQQEQPSWVAPTLAVLAHESFSDPAWLFERKLDGVHCLALRRGWDLQLRSRPRQKLVARVAFGELTGEGKVRHLRFLGPREDKRAREVVLETAA